MKPARSQADLVQDAIWSIHFGDVALGRRRLSNAEARALLEAYLETKRLLHDALGKAQRLAEDAAAQRAVVEALTNELDEHEQGKR